MSAIVLPDSIAATSKRLFWPLQTVGWLGYFILHFTAAMGDGKPLRYVTASLSVTACGFVITSLLRQAIDAFGDCPSRRWRPPRSG
ncbi:hypothetical protein [Lysobacter capsici]|uniref:hypothetical protein n=1 Tax=Lysobacter capsici TaxID=435897 RepID=UPI00398D24DC